VDARLSCNNTHRHFLRLLEELAHPRIRSAPRSIGCPIPDVEHGEKFCPKRKLTACPQTTVRANEAIVTLNSWILNVDAGTADGANRPRLFSPPHRALGGGPCAADQWIAIAKRVQRSLPGSQMASVGNGDLPLSHYRSPSDPPHPKPASVQSPCIRSLGRTLIRPILPSQSSNFQTSSSFTFSPTSPRTRVMPVNMHGSVFSIVWGSTIAINSGCDFYYR